METIGPPRPAFHELSRSARLQPLAPLHSGVCSSVCALRHCACPFPKRKGPCYSGGRKNWLLRPSVWALLLWGTPEPAIQIGLCVDRSLRVVLTWTWRDTRVRLSARVLHTVRVRAILARAGQKLASASDPDMDLLGEELYVIA